MIIFHPGPTHLQRVSASLFGRLDHPIYPSLTMIGNSSKQLMHRWSNSARPFQSYRTDANKLLLSSFAGEALGAANLCDQPDSEHSSVCHPSGPCNSSSTVSAL